MLKPAQYKALVEANQKLLDEANSAGGTLHALASSLRLLPSCDTLYYYRPEHFKLPELVPPAIYAQYGERAWMFLDIRAVWTIDAIREYFKASTFVNRPNLGLTERGLRITIDPKVRSQHNDGRATDSDTVGISAEEQRKEILTHSDHPYFRFITRMEANVPWLHIDCAATSDRINIFKK